MGRRLLVTVALLGIVFLPGCRSEDAAPGLSDPPPRVDLPRLGTIGDLPTDTPRIVVEADADGLVTIDGRPGDERDLAAILRAASDDEPVVLLQLDRRLPWAHAVRLLLACAEPSAGLDRVFLAVRPEAGDDLGAVAVRLDVSSTAWSDVDRLPLAARIRRNGPGADPAALYAHVRRHLAADPTLPAEVSADGLVSLDAVLAAADACRRAGVRGLDLVIPPAPGDASVGAASTGQGTEIVILLGEKLPDGTAGEPPPAPRVREAFLGTLRLRSPAREALVRVTVAPDVASLTEADLGLISSNGGLPRGDEEHALATPPEVPPDFRAFVGSTFEPVRLRSPVYPTRGDTGAVDLALEWLRQHQSTPGCWDCDGFEARCKLNRCGGAGAADHDVGVTGLATLAFLGAGETHRSGEYRVTVKKALAFLKRNQGSEGCFTPRVSPRFVYDHAIATLAMAEAYRLTRSPLFRSAAQRGIDFIERCRNPYLAWRYGIRPQDNDTSVTGWMVLALASAKRGGLRVPTEAFEGAAAWLDKITEPEFGVVGYTARGGAARYGDVTSTRDHLASLTAVGVLARCLLGERPEQSEMIQKGAEVCLKCLPEWGDGTTDFSYWLFGTMAMRRVGAEPWSAWHVSMKTTIIDHQRKDGDQRGSWDPRSRWGAVGGRVYTTAAAAICLEIYRGMEHHLARPVPPLEPRR